MTDQNGKFESVDKVREGFKGAGYICNTDIATTVYLAFHLGKPVLVEGPAGVGKTELAKKAADFMGVPLIPAAVLRGARRVEGALRVEVRKAAALQPAAEGQLIGGSSTRRATWASRSARCISTKTFSSPRSFSSRGRFSRRSSQSRAPCCSSTRWTRPMRNSKPSSWRSCRISRSRSPRSERCTRRPSPTYFSPAMSTRELSEALKRRCLHLFIPFPEPELEREIVRLPCASQK